MQEKNRASMGRRQLTLGLAAMGLADLIAWRERARVRAEPAED